MNMYMNKKMYMTIKIYMNIKIDMDMYIHGKEHRPSTHRHIDVDLNMYMDKYMDIHV
jgi:hypothetical protein